MERWAANTLRILGIIVTSLVVICGSLLLVLLGKCAAQGGFEGSRNSDTATIYYFGALVLGFGGIWFIAWLTRGIHRSTQTSQTPVPSPEASAPSQPAPAALPAVELLTWSLIAKLVVSALSLAYTLLQYQRMPYMRHATVPTVVSTVLSALPFALVLLYLLRQRISRAVLAFALGAPAAGILMSLVTTVPEFRLYLRNPLNLSIIFILGVPLVIDIAIIVLAYQAQKPAGLTLPASSVFTAVAASLAYFYSLHLITQFVYRNFAR